MENLEQSETTDRNRAGAHVVTNYGYIADYADFFRHVSGRGFFTDRDLWAGPWEEFVKDFLKLNHQFQSHNVNYKFKIVTFDRVFHLLTAGKVRDYLEEAPIKSEWDKDDHICRLLSKVFDANSRLDRGALYGLTEIPYDLADYYVPLHNIWKIFIDEREKWNRKNPYLTKANRPKMSGMTKIRIRRAAKSKAEGPNKHGGQLDILWRKIGVNKSYSRCFNGLNRKTCPAIMDEIVASFGLDAKQARNALISFSEDYSDLETRFGKRLKDIRASELLDERPRLSQSRWKKLQDQAVLSELPLHATLRIDSEESEMTNPEKDIANENDVDEDEDDEEPKPQTDIHVEPTREIREEAVSTPSPPKDAHENEQDSELESFQSEDIGAD